MAVMRRQLPPQIRRVELARRAASKPIVRYQLTVDHGLVDASATSYASGMQLRACVVRRRHMPTPRKYDPPLLTKRSKTTKGNKGV